jgi:hypothetical protein
MEPVLLTVRAHLNGTQIHLDADLALKPGARLLVTVLDDAESLTGDARRVREAMQSSEAAFARVWDNEEDAVYDNL